jgi:hypothetical protein
MWRIQNLNMDLECNGKVKKKHYWYNSKHKIKCEVWNVLQLFRCDSLQEKKTVKNEIYYCLKVFNTK